jgi:hypothetical protein
MTFNRRFLTAILFALIWTVFATATVFAHVCTPADKLPGAGSIGVYNIVTETFYPGKKLSPNMANGGFVTITDEETFAYDVFLHQLLPDGALAAGPGGDDLCDGVGIDLFLVCIGVPLED